MRNFDQIMENIKTQREQVIDARSEADYTKAHIPNAQNVPYNDLFDSSTGLLKTREDLAKCKF